MKKKILFFIILVSLIMISCFNGKMPSGQEAGDTLKLKYSELLNIVRYPNYTVVDVADPWHDGKLLHTYVLVSDNIANDHLPKGTIVRTPLKRSIPFTSVHSSLIIELGKQKAIAGVADLKYIKLPYIQKHCADGDIKDIGSAMMPDIETVIDIKPDAMLISPFNNNGGYGKLETLNIPIIECADYMETSALGRAEWMLFYGMLFGAEETADSLFAVVDSCYNTLKNKAYMSTDRRSILMDKITGPVWYMPGGRSTIGMMLSDANAIYPFAEDTHSGSLSLSFETVLEQAGESDLWLFRYNSPYPITYSQLLSEYHGYSQMAAFRNRKCYGCNVETSLFYEETPFRPDYHLSDLIRITHPNMDNLAPLRYYKAVDE